MDPTHETEEERIRRIFGMTLAIHARESAAITVYLMHENQAAYFLSEILVRTAQFGPETYMACIAANLYGPALNHLATEFQTKPPYIEDIRLALESGIEDGLFLVTPTGATKPSPNVPGGILYEYRVTLSQHPTTEAS